MFSYRPPKGSYWGHAMLPKNTLKALKKMHHFFETYFEPVEPEGLTLNLNPFGDTANYVPAVREKVVQIFGRPGHPDSMDWVLAPGDYQRAMNLIVSCPPSPKPPSDPIWLSFKCHLAWKNSALPNVEWPEEFLEPENKKWRGPFLILTMRSGGRFMFPLGIQIPISIKEKSSYEFLGRFAADAPFKMNPKHFQVLVPVGKKGALAFRKPGPEIAAQLRQALTKLS